MIFRHGSPSGQSVLETVLMMPLLLLLLAGGYWAFRNLELSTSAESAAHAQMLRTGRNLPPIGDGLARTIYHVESRVLLRGENRSFGGSIPPFGGMTGRTVASAAVSVDRERVGGFVDLPLHDIRREAEGAVDCWGKGTKSGSTIRRTVQGIALLGALR